jgi:vWA found in TerF C terminus/TerD domain
VARFVPGRGGERAMILAELYRRSGQWKIRAVGQGYVGGLGPMAREYGVDISDDPDQAAPAAPVSAPPAVPVSAPPAVPVSAPPAVPPSLARSGPPPLPSLARPGPPPLPSGAPPLPAGKPKLSLEKKLDTLGVTSPKLLTLAKTAQLSLKKRNLDGHEAIVGLCMDVSGSMGDMFQDGTVQTVIERVLGLGLNFDDNGAIDIFAFAAQSQYIGELRHDRFPGAAAWIQREEECGGTTSYAPAIWKILEHYGYAKNGKPLTEVKLPAQRPVYLLFITDGGNDDKNPSKAAIEAAARFPVFFQFIGIGGAEFPFLERLDDLKGRFLDNVDFFEMNNPAQVPESELYDKVMAEYPKWLQQARLKNITN